MRASLRRVPVTEWRRNFSQPSARMRAEWRTLLMMMGRMVLSSKLPWLPAKATAVSSPMTWMQIMTMASHWVGLTLPGMMELPGSLSGEEEFAEAAAGAGGEPAHVVGDFHEGDGGAAEAGAGADHGVERGLGGEFVGGGDVGLAGEVGDLGGDFDAEAGGGGEAGADGGAADGEFEQAGAGAADVGDGVADLVGVAGPFLADGEGDGVFEVGAADLDDVGPGLGLGLDGGGEGVELGEEVVVEFLHGGDVHGGGEGVVAGLGPC